MINELFAIDAQARIEKVDQVQRHLLRKAKAPAMLAQLRTELLAVQKACCQRAPPARLPTIRFPYGASDSYEGAGNMYIVSFPNPLFSENDIVLVHAGSSILSAVEDDLSLRAFYGYSVWTRAGIPIDAGYLPSSVQDGESLNKMARH